MNTKKMPPEEIRNKFVRATGFDSEPVKASAPFSTPPGAYLNEEGYTEHMNAPTREEFDAKLQTVKVENDARLKAIETSLSHIEGTLRDWRTMLLGTAVTVILFVVGTGLTVFFGMQASNQALVQTTISGFDSGRDVAKAQAELAAQIEKLSAAQDRLDARLSKGDTPAPEAASTAKP
ncbi:hypothetical protein [Cupriavidus gilardii]|uniref:hypothetical protein n=1 Tax=Cupriavidus gilardii TaxID=82541 RepID=UPI002B2A6B6B|nr:hypothetical protein QWJ31_07875 [Cupriavidus gilardii]